MVTKVREDWWILRFNSAHRQLVWFGYSEGEVRGKFMRWLRRGAEL